MEEKNRFERGMETLREVDGNTGQEVVEALEDVAPDLGRYIVEFAFGDVYSRPDLSLRDRELVTLASLCTQGDTAPQLEVHINAALNVGLSRQEIIGCFIQCVPYTGFPRVLNAVAVVRRVFAAREHS
ncbi:MULTISPECIES: carboxymuconolactone decarboxylase family protein [unclassified Actinobaculum]|uniref:carboxymuconolactone decarboxylase family protein n=1 Tax=unclassified Actinobaculum TaxID=2609299 RepID=UPI000D527317|nr:MULTISPECIES: carboxymuconolactone decarboxylase family protein [unclassified Actinobaculum]AWE42097.1 carboxymuconolactone decarboxylase [Actinobaculum sp. 313]RTE50651.1 carboxymuconolactone decarboxylase family protein [Actinobaculum sp. 352]